jgi:D-3-phosphoglycerate dehydrogenase
MLPIVDILTLHCPLTTETRNLISTQELQLMKAGSILVNMSRGAVVNEAALCQALRSLETIAAAASDVFQIEPACKETVNGLFDLDNFIGTPHIGGSTVEAQIGVCVQAIDQLADIFDGRQVYNRVC